MKGNWCCVHLGVWWCVPKTLVFASDLERPEGKGQGKTTIRESEVKKEGRKESELVRARIWFAFQWPEWSSSYVAGLWEFAV